MVANMCTNFGIIQFSSLKILLICGEKRQWAAFHHRLFFWTPCIIRLCHGLMDLSFADYDGQVYGGGGGGHQLLTA